MLVYYLNEIGRRTNRLRVTNTIAPCGIPDTEFDIQKSVAESVVDSVLSKYPTELEDAVVTITYKGATIRVAPKHLMFSEVYPEESTEITVESEQVMDGDV